MTLLRTASLIQRSSVEVLTVSKMRRRARCNEPGLHVASNACIPRDSGERLTKVSTMVLEPLWRARESKSVLLHGISEATVSVF